MSRLAVLLLLVLVSACQTPPAPLDAERWSEYRQRFISSDGRVIDNGNGGISHSEGQGYGMLLAVSADDRQTFERLWRWTETHLAVREDHLFAWKWVPDADVPVPDRNNATDGDLLIAWALSRAARRFDRPAYGREAAAIASDLRRQVASDSAFGSLLLPGAYGFEREEGMVINPSYLIFPAFDELAQWDDSAYWQRAGRDGTRLLRAVLERFEGLPPDWLLLSGRTMAAAPGKPLRFGFDALRVPLYVCWQGNRQQLPLGAVAALWRSDAAPAWVSLEGGGKAGFALTPAHHSARWLLRRCTEAEAGGEVVFPPLGEHYYGATLALLVEAAWKERHE